MKPHRFVTLNVQRVTGEPPEDLDKRMRAVGDFLLELEPDVVCVQEALPEAWRVLAEAMNGHGEVFCPRVDGMESGEGVGIIWRGPLADEIETHRFWFSETPEEPSKSWRAAHPRVCTVLRNRNGDASCWWISLHLDHRSRQARRNSLDLLAKWINRNVPENDPLVIGGDFNMTSHKPAFKNLMDQVPRLSSAVEHHPIAGLKPTFRGWGPLKWAKARIDHCLHSPEWRCTSYQADTPRKRGRPLSDHRALVVDLSPS